MTYAAPMFVPSERRSVTVRRMADDTADKPTAKTEGPSPEERTRRMVAAVGRLLACAEAADVPKSKRRGRVAVALAVTQSTLSRWTTGATVPDLATVLHAEYAAALAERAGFGVLAGGP